LSLADGLASVAADQLPERSHTIGEMIPFWLIAAPESTSQL
jgi:hypothetical protein